MYRIWILIVWLFLSLRSSLPRAAGMTSFGQSSISSSPRTNLQRLLVIRLRRYCVLFPKHMTARQRSIVLLVRMSRGKILVVRFPTSAVHSSQASRACAKRKVGGQASALSMGQNQRSIKAEDTPWALLLTVNDTVACSLARKNKTDTTAVQCTSTTRHVS